MYLSFKLTKNIFKLNKKMTNLDRITPRKLCQYFYSLLRIVLYINEN